MEQLDSDKKIYNRYLRDGLSGVSVEVFDTKGYDPNAQMDLSLTRTANGLPALDENGNEWNKFIEQQEWPSNKLYFYIVDVDHGQYVVIRNQPFPQVMLEDRSILELGVLEGGMIHGCLAAAINQHGSVHIGSAE